VPFFCDPAQNFTSWSIVIPCPLEAPNPDELKGEWMAKNLPLYGQILLLSFFSNPIQAKALEFDGKPARHGEWGFRPQDQSRSPTNPPSFTWRPQREAVTYQLQCSQDPSFQEVFYGVKHLTYPCHRPPETFPLGRSYWRLRFLDSKEEASEYSQVRSFLITEKAADFPMPEREELLARIPDTHPRLFLRPEQLPRLKELAQGKLRKQYEGLVDRCEKLLSDPPPTKEPLKYGKEVEYKSEEWRELWWGNRVYTVRVLDSAASLAFTRLLGGKEEYGQLAKRLLLDAAQWDPKGSTGYRYNDEAGMPYAYHFARTYTFVHDLLTEKERALCRKVMSVRGKEMYDHLCPRHLWTPYSSHSNRAWHFLGEVGIAFLGEIPEAEEWVVFATNVFFNVYPVWSDDQGGWHEGVSYWRSYIDRFTWWADVMRSAMQIDAYRKPYFSKIGYYPMYLQPPGTQGGGFGDLCANKLSRHNIPLMTVLASQARNPYWQWYVEVHGGPQPKGGYVGFLRGATPTVEGTPPTDLPSSRCFWGTGQAMMNFNLLDAKDNVQVLFKSSPFGTQSHGYDAQNSFLLYAFGERLFIRSGKRDLYGSDHHRNWMWHTQSVNSITVNAQSQYKRSPQAKGEILAFHTSDQFDYVSGEAGEAYEVPVDRFTRHIIFVKPDLILIYDQLETPEPSTFEWRLHSPTEIQLEGQERIHCENGEAACELAFLQPKDLNISLTDQFDPPPRPRVKLVEWHLTAKTSKPLEKNQFIALLRPHRLQEDRPIQAEMTSLKNGYAVQARSERGPVLFLLRRTEGVLRFEDHAVVDDLLVLLHPTDGKRTVSLSVHGNTVVEQ